MKLDCTKKEFVAAANTFLRTGNKVRCTMFIRKFSGTGLKEAKELTDKIFESGICVENKSRCMRGLQFKSASVFHNHNLRLAWEFTM
jgi:hypothetical protein